MSKWYVALLSVVVLFSIYLLHHSNGYKACIEHSDKTDASLCKCSYDYHVNISDDGTQIYDSNGDFVDFLPFDSTQAFDKAMLKDNL